MSIFNLEFKVLIIDDNHQIHKDYKKILTGLKSDHSDLINKEAAFFGTQNSLFEKNVSDPEISFIVDSTFQGQDGFEMIKKSHEINKPYAMAFIDMRMPMGWDGLETSYQILKFCSDIQIVICTAYSNYSWEEILKKLGQSDRVVILKKPFDPIEVYQLASSLCQKWRLKRESQQRLIELQISNKMLDEASKTKNMFVASVSHEIRTPLNAIIGMADLLLETALTEEQLRFVKIFQRSSHSLLLIINDILDLSKIETGQLDLELREIDIYHIVTEVYDLLLSIAEEKGLKLIINFENNLVTKRYGDQIRLRQILINLVGNAIKFTKEGSVTISIYNSEISPNDMVFKITDTGIGIHKEQQGKIFESFTQADSSITRKFGGTGLGLSISKKLIELMNGKIEVDSALGKGTTFTFYVSLPIQYLKSKPSQLSSSLDNDLSLKSKNILFVDNEPVILELLKDIFPSSEFNIFTASDGIMALNLLKHNSMDLIISDLAMPNLDGLNFLSNLRSMGNSTPFVILSGIVNNFDEQVATRLGVLKILEKPIKKEDLLKEIQSLLTLKESPTTLESIQKNRKDLINILLVDDSDDNRLLIKSFLKGKRYHIVEAQDGQEAFELFKQHKFDLVLMDIQMPILDGHSATQKIREWEKIQKKAKTQIIALSAYALKDEIIKSLDAGCNSHITKPVRKQILIEAIEKIFGSDTTKKSA